MTHRFLYEHCDVPPEMTIADYRRLRCEPPRRPGAFKRSLDRLRGAAAPRSGSGANERRS